MPHADGRAPAPDDVISPRTPEPAQAVTHSLPAAMPPASDIAPADADRKPVPTPEPVQPATQSLPEAMPPARDNAADAMHPSAPEPALVAARSPPAAKPPPSNIATAPDGISAEPEQLSQSYVVTSNTTSSSGLEHMTGPAPTEGSTRQPAPESTQPDASSRVSTNGTKPEPSHSPQHQTYTVPVLNPPVPDFKPGHPAAPVPPPGQSSLSKSSKKRRSAYRSPSIRRRHTNPRNRSSTKQKLQASKRSPGEQRRRSNAPNPRQQRFRRIPYKRFPSSSMSRTKRTPKPHTPRSNVYSRNRRRIPKQRLRSRTHPTRHARRSPPKVHIVPHRAVAQSKRRAAAKKRLHLAKLAKRNAERQRARANRRRKHGRSSHSDRSDSTNPRQSRLDRDARNPRTVRRPRRGRAGQ